MMTNIRRKTMDLDKEDIFGAKIISIVVKFLWKIFHTLDSLSMYFLCEQINTFTHRGFKENLERYMFKLKNSSHLY